VIIGLAFGFVYLLIIPVGAVPDEPSHMYNAYNLSNRMMGIDAGDGSNILARADDVNFPFRFRKITKKYYNTYYEAFFDKAEDTTLTGSTYPVMSDVPAFLYFLPALGITLGRLAGLGTLMTFSLGRLFNMLFFVWAIYYSIKKLPFGKSVMFVWAVLPKVLQQTSSYSYDNGIFALSAIITALTLKFLYSSEKPKKSEIIIYVLALILIIPCKQHALFPVAAFSLTLVVKYLKQKREKLKAFAEAHKKKICWIVAVCGCLVLAAAAVKGVQTVRYLTADDMINTNYIEYANHTGYTVGYFIKNPVKLLLIFYQTIMGQGETFLREMLGDYLGWRSIFVSGLFISVYIVLFVFAFMRRENEEVYIGAGTKAYMWLISLLVCGIAMMAMLLYWTANTEYAIAGVQGRYFLPVLPMALLACRSRKTCTGRDTDRTVMLMAVYIQIFILISFFRNFG
jgi:uncharacterized membrane protein